MRWPPSRLGGLMGTDPTWLTCVTKITDSFSLTCIHRLRYGWAPIFAAGRLRSACAHCANFGAAHEAHLVARSWRLSGGEPRDRRGCGANDRRGPRLLRTRSSPRLLAEVDGRDRGQFGELVRLLHRL